MDYGVVIKMNKVEYKHNRLLIIFLIAGLTNFALEIILLIFFGIVTILLELSWFIIWVTSAHLTYKDAQRLRAGGFREQRLFEPVTWSPTSWGIVVLFFWIIMLPLYLFMREELFWEIPPASIDHYKPVRHYIESVKRKPPAPKSTIYGKNVLFCPNCETPYSKKMLERSLFCKYCGELLKKE